MENDGGVREENSGVITLNGFYLSYFYLHGVFFCLLYQQQTISKTNWIIYQILQCVWILLGWSVASETPITFSDMVPPWINKISPHNTVCELSQQTVSPHFNTSTAITTLCISSSPPFWAVGGALPSLIPADKHRIKMTDEENQNKHNEDNVFLLLLVSPSDKCCAHSVASWHACLRQPY